MKKIFFFAAAAAISLVACNKSETALKTPIQKSPQKVDLSSINDGNRIFTDEQIEQIGIIHNQTVIDFVNNFNYNTDNIYAEFVNQVSQWDISPMELAKLPNGVSTSEYYYEVIKANLSEKAHAFIYGVADNFITFNNVNDLAEYIELQKSYAKGIFKGAELDIVLTTLTVYKYSAKLWFDTTEGGMGLIDVFSERCGITGVEQAPANSLMKISEKKKQAIIACLVADGNGASEAIVVAAIIVACGVELTPAAIAAIAISAGVSSISKLIEVVKAHYVVVGPVEPDEPDIVIKWKDYIRVDGKLIALPLINPYFQ
ncbi:MAG: hypothetical protein LBN95_00115 [Prevotellaceae bacterium]|jgi:hypothetical protein|nr:hypothetical protein [Prevotellaceae bacterium]